jgi:nucleotide-binding universal stress UspA family protein
MTILCGTDFSASSLEACEAAALVAAGHDEPLVLVHAVTPAPDGDASSAENALDDLAARLRTGGVEISTSIKVGAPDEVLLAEVERTDARMIVLGSVGARGLKVLLGSTSDRIASRATVPVFVVRSGFPGASWLRDKKPLRVAVAADLGPSTSAAVQWASQLAGRGPCEFVAMHVSGPPEEYAFDAPMQLDRTHPLVEQVVRRELDGVASRLQGTAETKIVVESNAGRIGASIAQIAGREGAGLLVVGRGREEGRRWLDRSVSREIIREAPMSVVSVPESNQVIPTAPPIRRVLCATDFSPLGNSAVLYANSLLVAGGDLMVVHVLEDGASSEDQSAAEEQMQSLLNTADKVNVIIQAITGDDPARLIAAAAERFGADVICVGSRGRSALTKAMLGSVSQGILLLTTRPVLMVPAPL